MDCSEQRQRFRRRVLVISLATRKTFEIVLAVSLNRLNSRAMSKDSLVENLIILIKGAFINDANPLDKE
jgi:hypothetical protein